MGEAKTTELPVLALDMGGTKIAAAIVDGKRIGERVYKPTQAGQGVQSVMARLFSMIDNTLNAHNLEASQLHSISIAAAGVIDTKQGVITLSPNLPGWRGIPLRDTVRDRYGVNTVLINDASAAALGEHRFGAGKGADNVVMLTVGTGIGGGIIIDGRLYIGPSGSAGEIGHMTIDIHGPKCQCGNTGCLEKLASGTAVTTEAIRRISQGEKSCLVDIVGDEIKNITAEEVEAAARSGDSLAREVIEQAATNLGIGLVNLVNIFNPEMIIIGGGVANMGDLLLEPARRVVRERAFPLPADAVRIVTAQLGADAGILGAAIFALEQEKAGRAS